MPISYYDPKQLFNKTNGIKITLINKITILVIKIEIKTYKI